MENQHGVGGTALLSLTCTGEAPVISVSSLLALSLIEWNIPSL